MYEYLIADDISATSCVIFVFWIVLLLLFFANTGNNLAKQQHKLSRNQINICIQKHPKSTWLIHNAPLVNYCGISSEKNAHNTTILGKFVPRKQSFWQRCAGMCLQTQITTIFRQILAYLNGCAQIRQMNTSVWLIWWVFIFWFTFDHSIWDFIYRYGIFSILIS